ncbi:hypothetical protein ACRRTK_001972 [Alexandromys fortis]
MEDSMDMDMSPLRPQNYLFGCELKADKDYHFKVDNDENEHQLSLRTMAVLHRECLPWRDTGTGPRPFQNRKKKRTWGGGHPKIPKGTRRRPRMQNALQGARFSDPARHGGLGTREAVLPVPSKPWAVALGAGHTSPGSRKLRGTILVAPGALLGELPLSQPAAMFTEAQEAAGGIGKTAPLDGSSAPRMPTMAGHGHRPSALCEQKK